VVVTIRECSRESVPGGSENSVSLLEDPGLRLHEGPEALHGREPPLDRLERGVEVPPLAEQVGQVRIGGGARWRSSSSKLSITVFPVAGHTAVRLQDLTRASVDDCRSSRPSNRRRYGESFRRPSRTFASTFPFAFPARGGQASMWKPTARA
jgi:hypothetical protein